jgi:hypothetical protein
MKKEAKKKESAEPKEHKPNWKEYVATIEDIERFLDERVLLRRNVVTGLVEASPDWLPVMLFPP